MSINNLSNESTVERVTNQSGGLEKNVLRQNKYACEDTVPYKVLKILADSVAKCQNGTPNTNNALAGDYHSIIAPFHIKVK